MGGAALSGAERDGYLYGRGALETTGLALIQLEAFLALHRSGRALDRPVLFATTADEEAGGYFGAGWMVRQRPDLIADVGFVLNEGGGGRRQGASPVFSVEVPQKIPLWLRVTARGTPGHGSSPRARTAPDDLIRALARVTEQRFALRLLPVVAEGMKAVADLKPPHLRPYYEAPDRLLDDAEGRLALRLDSSGAHALLRDTCALTRLGGSLKINVIPSQAWAELDCRLLPDTDPDAFIAQLETLIDDPDQVTRLRAYRRRLSTETALYGDRGHAHGSPSPGPVVPAMAGFTDSHFSGWTSPPTALAPYSRPASLGCGHNERVNIEAFKAGVGLYHTI